ncbi:NADPH-dependent oxidoreductase [Halobiforma lacisalsi AJ5]|uniref:NADPH-dependent FMN reductase n=1 Tax=Natronobacterium lacisalsi AJ5 TaxID=358396 RepID=M0LNF0_NATLA|nr:NADPH-dependent FMN reductase [Halobiforma lacisalsi]APW97157.1 NADPH-dependent oxidoreductase [Halobiforma lacisalsi AJ5]EMA33989.1 NADPH-dependent FMN reductase [Halobiforma lacisalsi AJ5]
MKDDVYIVGLCGSLAPDSGTRVIVREALAAAERAGAETTLVDLREYDLPMFEPHRPDAGDAPELRRHVDRADGVVLGTPMYHGTVSSPLKTALDYCGGDEFEETTVGLAAVAGGSFPTPALEHLRSVARALGAWTLPHQVGIPDSHERFADGELVDDDLRERTRRLGRELVDYAGVTSYPEVAEKPIEAQSTP